MKKYLLSLSALLLCGGIGAAADQAPAFPGAEGHGRYTTGGRGGNVIHVTNLNDNGAGSFREAVKGNNKKIVVFDVSGYIDLESDVQIGANTTIAGQTAPGDGITLRYYTVQPHGDNIIIRFIRSRRSQVKDVNDGADAMWCRNYKNIMIDHCSLSWSIDELGSFYDNRNFTMQWSLLAEGLANPGHSKGAHSYGGIWGGKNVSFHHNMICHVQNRCPRFNGARYSWTGYDNTKYASTVDAERVDFRNCLMYNWGNGSACYGGPGGGYINIVNNYYKSGPGTKNKTTVTQCSVATSGNADEKHPELYDQASRYFIEGNYVTAAANPENFDWNGVKYDSGCVNLYGEKYTQDKGNYYTIEIDNKVVAGETTYVPMKLKAAVDPGTVTTHAATDAYAKILDYCGSSLKRDACDVRYMEEARTGTVTYYGDVAYVDANGKTYATSNTPGILDFINDPEGVQNEKTASYPTLIAETRPADFDTDKDGMPDAWETLNGLNPNNAADAKTYTLDSKGYYTNVEVYLNQLVEHIMKAGNADASAPVDEYYPSAQSGIANVTVGSSEIKTIEYYDLNGIRLEEPVEGINIRRIVFADGHVESDKVVK